MYRFLNKMYRFKKGLFFKESLNLLECHSPQYFTRKEDRSRKQDNEHDPRYLADYGVFFHLNLLPSQNGGHPDVPERESEREQDECQ